MKILLLWSILIISAMVTDVAHASYLNCDTDNHGNMNCQVQDNSHDDNN